MTKWWHPKAQKYNHVLETKPLELQLAIQLMNQIDQVRQNASGHKKDHAWWPCCPSRPSGILQGFLNHIRHCGRQHRKTQRHTFEYRKWSGAKYAAVCTPAHRCTPPNWCWVMFAERFIGPLVGRSRRDWKNCRVLSLETWVCESTLVHSVYLASVAIVKDLVRNRALNRVSVSLWLSLL